MLRNIPKLLGSTKASELLNYKPSATLLKKSRLISEALVKHFETHNLLNNPKNA